MKGHCIPGQAVLEQKSTFPRGNYTWNAERSLSASIATRHWYDEAVSSSDLSRINRLTSLDICSNSSLASNSLRRRIRVSRYNLSHSRVDCAPEYVGCHKYASAGDQSVTYPFLQHGRIATQYLLTITTV